MSGVYVVVVIYNMRCKNSSTCQSLEKIEGISVIIADNSTQDNDNEEFALARGWIYIYMNGNMGLSKAYNRAVEAVKQPEALICLFDDDSKVEDDYFACLEEAALADEAASVFMPRTFDQYGLMSPSIINGFRERRAKDISEFTQENITGINSGMAIKRKVFDTYRYDERFFLDYVDHNFIRDMKRRNQKISITNAKIYHCGFFESTQDDFEPIAARMRIFKKDYKIFCGKSIRGRFAYLDGVLKHKLYFFLKFGMKIKYLFI